MRVKKQKPLSQTNSPILVLETEIQASSSDSEDDIPVARLLQEPKTVSRLSLQDIEECKEGPKGEKAIGKVVAKMFDGVEFRGKVDSFRQVRQRFCTTNIYKF